MPYEAVGRERYLPGARSSVQRLPDADDAHRACISCPRDYLVAIRVEGLEDDAGVVGEPADHAQVEAREVGEAEGGKPIEELSCALDLSRYGVLRAVHLLNGGEGPVIEDAQYGRGDIAVHLRFLSQPPVDLLARIALQAEADVIVVGGMGLKYDDYLFFKNQLAPNKERTIMFVHTAADPVVECMMVPDMALAAAENYATAGQRVLVLLSDMTAFADAMKEVAVAMEQIPANRGYPGDLYSQLASRYEKAVDIEGAGSITLLAVTTMPGDDVTHPVPDNTGYITEGQFYLKGGVIDPFGSLSRLKQQVNKKTREDHADLMNAMVRIYDSARKARQQASMGFALSELDQKILRYGEEFERRMMDLQVNLPLEQQLDLGWEILKNHFTKDQTGLPSKLTDRFWT